MVGRVDCGFPFAFGGFNQCWSTNFLIGRINSGRSGRSMSLRHYQLYCQWPNDLERRQTAAETVRRSEPRSRGACEKARLGRSVRAAEKSSLHIRRVRLWYQHNGKLPMKAPVNPLFRCGTSGYLKEGLGGSIRNRCGP